MNAFDRIAIFRNAIKDRTTGFVAIKVEDLRWMLDLVEATARGDDADDGTSEVVEAEVAENIQ